MSVLFDNLASGWTLDEILDDFPTLERGIAIEALRQAQVLLSQTATQYAHLDDVLAAAQHIATRDAEALAALAELEAAEAAARMTAPPEIKPPLVKDDADEQ